MTDKNDRRLRGQEDYLKGALLGLYKYEVEDEHEHCDFCWKTVGENPTDDGKTTDTAYATDDLRTWVCPACFEDFREYLGLRVTDGGVMKSFRRRSVKNSVNIGSLRAEQHSYEEK